MITVQSAIAEGGRCEASSAIYPYNRQESVIITVEKKMPRGQPIPQEDVAHIMDLFLDCRKRGMSIMDSYARIGQQLGRDTKVIGTVVNRMKPSTDTARMLFRAKAYKMARRVIKKGSPAELIDILSRPNIGVLESAKGKGDEGQGGFMLSVSADTCGAVKVGLATMKEAPALASGEAFDPFSETIDVGQGESHGENGNAVDAGRVEGAESGLSVIERIRQKLARVRETRSESA